MNNKKMSNLFTCISLILIVIVLGVLVYGYYKKKTFTAENPIVTMEVENFGTIKLELYPNLAPETVSNFIKLANNGVYNGLKFHRVVDGFMIQGGDIEGTGQGSPTFSKLFNNEDENVKYKYSDGTEAKSTDSYTIPGEFIVNGYYDNTMNLTEGTLAMARADYTAQSSTLTKESYDSAGSQFFIMTTDDHTNLSGYYAGFGKVIEGMDVVKQIEKVECQVAKTGEEESNDEASEEEGSEEQENSENENSEEEEGKEKSSPVNDVIITSVSVDTKGIDYGIPKTLKPFNYTKWLYELYGLEYTEE